MPTAIIILNWNAADDTIACIQSIQRWKNICFQIYVVDNHSIPADTDKLLQKQHGFHLIRNDFNAGFSGGCNVGIQAALKDSCGAILLLNSDARINEQNFLLLFNALQSNPDIGVIGPVIYNPANGTVINAGGKDVGWNYITHHHQILNFRHPYDVDYVSGTVFLARSELFRKIGMLDERFFFSGEIADFCQRLRRYSTENGYRSRVVIHPYAAAYHDIHGSSKDRDALYAYYIIRNRYLYIRKYSKPFLWVLYPLWTYRHLRHAVACIREKKNQNAAVTIKAIFHGILGKVGKIS